jgi:two-component system LytT family response regulator
MSRLRVAIADDERPARSFLAGLLRQSDGVDLIGEAPNGAEAVKLIEREQPDLALLDLQMPELDGLGVVRMLDKDRMPLVAFVTAYDDYAVRAFELNAVDYLLKPVDRARLGDTLQRARERLARADLRQEAAARVETAAADYERAVRAPLLERIPIRHRDEILILPIREIASIEADGELLRLTTAANDRYTITYRLKDLEARLDPARFIRLSRGTLANLDMLCRVSPMPGGTYVATLSNGRQLQISRSQGRILRDHLLKL